MPIRFPKHKTYPALSLVEVLIVLALVATTMIAATQVTVSALIKIKQNEVDDYVNGLLVRVVEAVKSPQVLTIDNSLTGLDEFAGGYILDLPSETEIAQGAEPAFSQQSTTLDRIQPANCDTNSPNYVTIPNFGTYVPPAVCMQALVVELTGVDAVPLYQVTVRAVYTLSDGPVERELVGYRRQDPANAGLPPPVTSGSCIQRGVVRDFPFVTVDTQGFSNYSDNLPIALLNTTYPKWQIQVSADGAPGAFATVSVAGVAYTNQGVGVPAGADDSSVSFNHLGQWEQLAYAPQTLIASGQTTVPSTVTITARAKYSLPPKYSINYCL